ncbi:MAG: translocation/assembly module TamB domain-containing protein [Acidobacteriia bacterium]|nr:translocation/assembly module TamB domain-containing protein [Terriglobia bacterium]
MSGPTPPRRRLWLRLLLLFCIFSAACLSILGWYVTTDSFQQKVRRRVTSALEKATGGRVELGQLHTIPFRLRIDARNLTIHGREGADQVPYLHIDRLQAEVKIISLLSTSIGLHSLVLEHPVMHVLVYPDGSTNQPSPPGGRSLSQKPVEQLFSLSASHMEVQHGEIQWNENRIPVDFDGRDVSFVLNYLLLHRQYQARLALGSVATRLPPYPEFVWRADTSLLLSHDHAEISTLTVASGRSEIHFQGRIENFHNPQISGNYHGLLDLGEWGHLLPQLEFRRGTAQFEGKGSWSLRDFSTQGTLQAKEVDWANPRVRMQNGRLTAAFTITPQRLHISSIRASLLGGDAQGDVDVANWQSSLDPASAARGHATGPVPSGSLQRGSVRLQLIGFPVAPAVSFLSSKKLPLDRLNLAGAASGEINMLWVGSIHDAETQIKLNVVPPAQPAAGQLAVRGQMDGVYRGSRDELEVNQLHLVTPASEITASGKLSASSSLKLTFLSHAVREWNPLLQAAYGSPDLPFAVRGWANFNGSVSGRLSTFSANGNLEAYDFETTLPATAQIPERVVHWDALTTSVQYSASNFSARNGALIHGRTVAHFDLSTGLTEATLQENSPFTLHLDILNADVAEIAQLAGSNRPISGTLNLSGTLAGTRADPHGDGHVEVQDAAAYGLPFPSVHSDLSLAHHQLQFNNLAGTLYDAPVSGNATISTTSNDFRVNLTGQNLDLAGVPNLHSDRITVDGRADFAVRASGTPEQPSIEAHVHLRDLAFDQERAGDFILDATTRGHQLEIQAHSDFEQAELKIRGNVGLERDFPADLSLDFRHFDMDSFLNIYLRGKVTGHSPLAGTAQLRGPLRTPRDLKVSAQIQTLNAELEHVQLQNVEPIRFEIADRVLHLENFHVTGSGTDFTAHGTAQLSGSRELDLHLEGAVNMSLLHTVVPKVSARGSLGVKLDANGTVADPVLQGRIEVKDTFLNHDDFPSGLSDLKGVLLFDRNRIQIESLTGTTGGGSVTLTGSGSFQNGLFLMDFGATAHDVRLRYPPGVSSTANADLRLTGSSASALLSGNVVVNKLAVTPGFDFGSYLERSKRSFAVAQHDSLESRLKLDVHVTTSPELQMQTAMAKLSGSADLRVRGTADRPVIMGRAVAEGDISFNGTKYHVDRADITFSNPARTEAIIDLQASTRVRDYDITVTLSGDVSKPNSLRATWRSEPPLPEADVIALLALGRTREESAAAQSGGSLGLGGEASNLLINEALNSAVNSRLQRLFGASRIKIDPQGLASATNVVRGPQVTIEQQVASNVTVTYSTNVSVASQQIIQVEYNVTRNISVVALRDQNGVVSFDIKVRQRKR